MNHFVWSTNPILLHLGFLKIHWYGLFFALGVFLAYYLVTKEVESEGVETQRIEAIFIPVVLGVIIGARLAHCLFYEPDFYLSHPIEILKVWKGGLASHGGIAGGILGLWWGAREQKLPFMWLLSRVSIFALITASFIRIGNFFNSEILGKATQVPWAVIFARIDTLPRHPVMLYESLGYFLISFILYIQLNKSIKDKALDWILTGEALIMIFTLRIILEYFKIPQADYSTDTIFNVGQLLSMPFLLIGFGILIYGIKLRKVSNA